MKQRDTARLHLIAAKEAPVAVIIRRKPSRLFHIIRWNLEDDTFEHGSWFKGHLYSMRSDLSWNGELMSYLARGNRGETWNGVCRIPRLTTILESENCGSYNGGGIFWKPNLFLLNDPWQNRIDQKPEWPRGMKVQFLPSSKGEDLSIIFHRFARDEWKVRLSGWEIDIFDDEGVTVVNQQSLYQNPLVRRPTPDHPELSVQYVGYKGKGMADYKGRSGYIFHFELEGFPDLLGPQVDWATWTNGGDLIWTRDGIAYRISMEALKAGKPPLKWDFNEVDRIPPGA